MTKDQMSRIIAEALRSFGWNDTNCPLPVYIANAIAIRQAEPILDDEGRYLGDAVPGHDDNPVIIALRKEIRQHLDAIERLTTNRCEMKREIEKLRGYERTHIENIDMLRSKLGEADADIARLKGTVKEWMDAFATLKEEQRKLSCDLEREKASNLDLKSKLEELTGVADEFEKENASQQAESERLKQIVKAQLATIERTTADLNKCGAKLEEAKAAQPHFYHASTMHMGDCSICGNMAGAPQHDVANWKERALAAEHNHQIAKDRLKELTTERDHFKKIANDAAGERMTALQHWKARAEKAEGNVEASEAHRSDLRRRLEKAEKRADDNWNLKEAAVLRATCAEERAERAELTIATIKKMMQ